MSYVPYFKPGSWIVECFLCGRMFKGEELRRTWDGKFVCQQDYEAKHPQLSVRGVKDQIRVPFSSPEGPDTYIDQQGYWEFDVRTDGDYSPVGKLDCYASSDGAFPVDRFSGDSCYVEGTT